MHWRISSFPELQHLSDAEREALLRSCVGKRFMPRLMISCVLRGMIVAIITMGLFVTNSIGVNPPPMQGYQLILPPILGAITSLGLFQFTIIRIRGQLRIYLHQQRKQGVSVPVCLKCGYAVAEGQDNCPECGAGT